MGAAQEAAVGQRCQVHVGVQETPVEALAALPMRVLRLCAAVMHKLSAGAGAEAAVPWRGAASPC